MNPYLIEGPASISFSGGRTSGYMLRKILDAHGGTLPADVHVIFANTGREREETLEFVRDCGQQWSVPIVWVEYRAPLERIDSDCAEARKWGDAWQDWSLFREVTFETASRNGEPFEAAVEARQYMPNPIVRSCTQDLKIRTMQRWLRAQGYEEWDNIVGLRADEARRVASLQGGQTNRERWGVLTPLHRAGATKRDVLAFWAEQPFDLRLKQYEGNCDVCYLKSLAVRRRLAREQPEKFAWWERMEKRRATLFRVDVASYEKIRESTERQPELFPMNDLDDAESLPCNCTD